jgi:hypothetical protein
MPSLSWRPSPLGIGEVTGPRPVERGADVVAVVGLDHDVVQHLGQVERRAGQCHRVMAGVAVEEPDLELDAGGELHLQPVGLPEAEAVGEECDTDSSNAVVANTTCPNPTPSVRKPPGTSG